MATVIVSVTLKPQTFAAGTVPGKLRFQVFQGPTLKEQQYAIDGGNSVTFPNIAPGDYTVVAQRLNSGLQALGAPVSGSFSVAAPAPVTCDVPDIITVELAP